MEKELSLNEKIDLLLEKEGKKDDEEKSKSWSLPWMTKFKFNVGKKKIEKGWASFIIIRNNRNLEFTRAPMKDGIAIIDGFPRICTVDHTLFHKRKPVYIVPEWSLKPFSPEDNYSETEKLKLSIAGRRAILAVLETEKIKPKRDWGNMGWILIAAVVVGAIWYFGKQQGWF